MVPSPQYLLENNTFFSAVNFLGWLETEYQTSVYGNLISSEIEVICFSGEKHGSWFVSFHWQSDGLTRSAELAFTNPGTLADEDTQSVLITIRPGASNNERFFYEDERVRAKVNTKTIWEAFTKLQKAIERANSFGVESLTFRYEFGPMGETSDA